MGTTWNVVRIGMRFGIEDFGDNLISTPRFGFGMSSGTSNLLMDVTTTHWFGAYSNGALWRRNPGTPPGALYTIGNAGYTNNSIVLAKRIGSTVTTGSALAQAADYNGIGDVTLAKRIVWFFEVTKGSPNFTVRFFSPLAGTTLVDVTPVQFLSNMELTAPSIAAHGWSGNVTMAIDETTNGFFNAVNIGWDRTSPAIEISDVSVVKFS